MTERTAYIGLGTNLGRRMAQLEEALRRLGGRDGVRITQVSSIYETAPVGYLDQPDFLNACAEVKTTRSPVELLQTLLEVEQELHRVRRIRWGPRTIDLDLLLYDDRIICEEQLVVPHPRMTDRSFVLIPLAEIAPDVVIPGTGQTVAWWAEKRKQESDVVKSPYTLNLQSLTACVKEVPEKWNR